MASSREPNVGAKRQAVKPVRVTCGARFVQRRAVCRRCGLGSPARDNLRTSPDSRRRLSVGCCTESVCRVRASCRVCSHAASGGFAHEHRSPGDCHFRGVLAVEPDHRLRKRWCCLQSCCTAALTFRTGWMASPMPPGDSRLSIRPWPPRHCSPRALPCTGRSTWDWCAVPTAGSPAFHRPPQVPAHTPPVDGARGRSRTDTLLRAADFPATSAFAAPSGTPTRVRGLEHAFTVAL